MNRRDFIALLCSASLVEPSAVAAQSANQKRVALFWGLALEDSQWKERFAVLNTALQKLGWIEGKNISFERVPAIGQLDRLPALATEMVASKVDVIVVQSAGLADVAHSATRSIPIVVIAAGDLEGSGLIASLKRPGGNVTGLQILSPNLMSKRLDLLKQLVPNLTRLGIVLPVTPAGMVTPRYLEVIDETARVVGVEPLRVEVHGPEQFGTAYAKLREEGCQAAIVISNPLSMGYRRQIVEAAVIPTMYEADVLVRDGGLVSYGPNALPLYRDAATYVDKILRGASPAELPVANPTQFELAINMKAAKSFGLTIPPTVLALADQVIE